MRAARRGVFPGSFDPATIAHLAIAEAARDQCALDLVVLSISRQALAKPGLVRVDERAAAARRLCGDRAWLRVAVTDAQLLADIAHGFDVLILGADKWGQVLDPDFYGSDDARDDAVARLPHVAFAPRRGTSLVPHGHPHTVLDLPGWVGEVSSTAVRAGRRDWAALPDTDDESG